MHTDENKMNFLRRVLNTMPSLTIREAFELLDAATDSFPSAAPTGAREGVMFGGRYFSPTADKFLRENKKIQAIREVRADNRDAYGAVLGLRESKDAVEARTAWMGWPAPEYRTY